MQTFPVLATLASCLRPKCTKVNREVVPLSHTQLNGLVCTYTITCHRQVERHTCKWLSSTYMGRYIHQKWLISILKCFTHVAGLNSLARSPLCDYPLLHSACVDQYVDQPQVLNINGQVAGWHDLHSVREMQTHGPGWAQWSHWTTPGWDRGLLDHKPLDKLTNCGKQNNPKYLPFDRKKSTCIVSLRLVFDRHPDTATFPSLQLHKLPL